MKGRKSLMGIRISKNTETTPQPEWVSAIAGILIAVSLLALIIYSIYSFYSLFYGCDCGDNIPLSKPVFIQSSDPIWRNFAKCKIKLDQNLSYKITYAPSVIPMGGKKITISGFIQPIEAKDKFSHFLLTKNAPTCAYCPPSKPNEVVEVFSFKPLTWKQDLVTISGTLILVNDSNNGIFFQMKDATEKQE